MDAFKISLQPVEKVRKWYNNSPEYLISVEPKTVQDSFKVVKFLVIESKDVYLYQVKD